MGRAKGWLILVSVEFAAHAYESLLVAGPIQPGGLYALEMLRVSAAEPAWPSELGDTVTAAEAGLVRTGGDAKRNTALVRIVLKEDRGALYGQEGILRNGLSVGLTTSGAWCRHAGVPVALGYVSDPNGIDRAWMDASSFAIDMPGGPAEASVKLVEAGA